MRTKALIGLALALGLGALIVRTRLSAHHLVGTLLVGWASYLARVVPRVVVSWEGVVTGLVCLVLLTLGLHGFLVWLSREIRRAATPEDQAPGDWKPRWTASIVAVVVLMFAAGISASGIVHQAGWLLASERPPATLRLDDRYTRYGGDSTAHLKEIGLAVSQYLDSNGSLPTGQSDARGRRLHSWRKDILPYLGVITGGEIQKDLPWDHPRNSAYFRGSVLTYLNPEIGAIRDTRGYALSHYAGNIHLLGRPGASGPGEIPDDASQTILAGEVTSRFKPWGDPSNLRDPSLGINASADGFGGPSGAGANFLFLDGSVRFLRDTIDTEVLHRMSGRAD